MVQDEVGNVIGLLNGTAVDQTVTYDDWGVATVSGSADNRLLFKGLLWEGTYTGSTTCGVGGFWWLQIKFRTGSSSVTPSSSFPRNYSECSYAFHRPTWHLLAVHQLPSCERSVAKACHACRELCPSGMCLDGRSWDRDFAARGYGHSAGK